MIKTIDTQIFWTRCYIICVLITTWYGTVVDTTKFYIDDTTSTLLKSLVFEVTQGVNLGLCKTTKYQKEISLDVYWITGRPLTSGTNKG